MQIGTEKGAGAEVMKGLHPLGSGRMDNIHATVAKERGELSMIRNQSIILICHEQLIRVSCSFILQQ